MNVFACVACGHVDFPRRLLCPSCGHDDFAEVAASTGSVEEVTILHHRAGKAGGDIAYLATVLTHAGPRLIVRLERLLASGAVVSLRLESDGAIVGFSD
ncbi:putative OB-fold protein [Caballeronia udeis]|uniref:OB-fold protein n=1 Tax=Caballeronia udeis TaxID=1232866 RepID=A0ABW8MEY6_9BURK